MSDDISNNLVNLIAPCFCGIFPCRKCVEKSIAEFLCYFSSTTTDNIFNKLVNDLYGLIA